MICQVCFKANHIALDCWHRFDYSYQTEQIPQALAAMNLNKKNHEPTFYADSGATSHMANNTGKMSHIVPYKGNDSIYVGNRERVKITHVGEAKITIDNGELRLKNVLAVPEIKKNVFSVGQLTSEFSSNDFVIKDRQGRILVKGCKKGGLYALREAEQQALVILKTNKASFSIWHQRMGFPHKKFLKHLQAKEFIDVS